MKTTPELIAACVEVTRAFPNVDHVFISVNGRWLFCEDDFEAPVLTQDEIDISLLEAMVDSLENLPAAFYIPEVLA